MDDVKQSADVSLTTDAAASSEMLTTKASALLPAEEAERLTNAIVAALKTVNDPEIPADIYELGLIYKVEIDDGRNVAIDMTLTAPGCGMGTVIASDAKSCIERVPGVSEAQVDVVWEPPWNPHMISAEGKARLGMD